jgi:PPK2 family polyphosphate:nucleotide phosphotransferase
MHLHRFEGRGGKVRLEKISCDPPDSVKKDDAKERFHELNEELFELQDLMWGAKTHSVLIVLQGRDAAGKDGAVKHVAGTLNPRGMAVSCFGVPTERERRHDFLWRVHRRAPGAGELAIFNRSHYEDVLVVRVKKLEPRAVWEERYELINAFERTLATAGTIVLKYFLHISNDEQKERLLERERDAKNAWKLSVEDWRQREHWDDFTAAYEDAIARCATKAAPWIVVPANAKWYRNLVVAETLAAALRPFSKGWRKTLDHRERLGRRELKKWRAENGA